jgi:hypothetical protein
VLTAPPSKNSAARTPAAPCDGYPCLKPDPRSCMRAHTSPRQGVQKEDERLHARLDLIVTPWIAVRLHVACDCARAGGGEWPTLSLKARLRILIGTLFPNLSTTANSRPSGPAARSRRQESGPSRYNFPSTGARPSAPFRNRTSSTHIDPPCTTSVSPTSGITATPTPKNAYSLAGDKP